MGTSIIFSTGISIIYSMGISIIFSIGFSIITSMIFSRSIVRSIGTSTITSYITSTIRSTGTGIYLITSIIFSFLIVSTSYRDVRDSLCTFVCLLRSSSRSPTILVSPSKIRSSFIMRSFSLIPMRRDLPVVSETIRPS